MAWHVLEISATRYGRDVIYPKYMLISYTEILAIHKFNSIQKHSNIYFLIKRAHNTSTYLSEEITEGPADKRREGLGSEGVLVESLVVGGPAGNGTAAGGRGVAEESTLLGGARRTLEGVGEGGLGQRALRNALLDRRGGLSDAEGRSGDEEGSNEDRGELHLSRYTWVIVWGLDDSSVQKVNGQRRANSRSADGGTS